MISINNVMDKFPRYIKSIEVNGITYNKVEDPYFSCHGGKSNILLSANDVLKMLQLNIATIKEHEDDVRVCESNNESNNIDLVKTLGVDKLDNTEISDSMFDIVDSIEADGIQYKNNKIKKYFEGNYEFEVAGKRWIANNKMSYACASDMLVAGSAKITCSSSTEYNENYNASSKPVDIKLVTAVSSTNDKCFARIDDKFVIVENIDDLNKYKAKEYTEDEVERFINLGTMKPILLEDKDMSYICNQFKKYKRCVELRKMRAFLECIKRSILDTYENERRNFRINTPDNSLRDIALSVTKVIDYKINNLISQENE